jgi:putative DNA primase/helicase
MPICKSLKRSSIDSKLRSLHRTDAGNAEALEYLHGDRFRFDHTRGKWMVWNGKYWCIDDAGEADRAALDTARARQSAALTVLDSKQKEEQVKWGIRSESAFARRATLSSAQSVKSLATTTGDYDRNPFLLTVGNGMLDLTTGELRQSQSVDLITRATAVNYLPSAKCPRWLRFLDEIFDADRKLIQFVRRAVGYSMTGDTREQCLFILCGDGANGKTTFQEIIYELLGTHAAPAPFSTFLVQRNHGSPRNDLAKLHGTRLVKACESAEGGLLDEAVVKALTGGDTISARYLFHEHFDFRPTFKLWLSTNHRPQIRGTDEAIWRRIRLISFSRQFLGKDRDPILLERLRAELPGVLAWAVEGCLEWLSEGLGDAPAVDDATREYRRDSDQVGRFIKASCHVSPRNQTGGNELYEAYVSWCAGCNEKPESNNAFAKYLAERGFEKKRTRRGVKYEGISLIPQPSPVATSKARRKSVVV